jgi:hypothetical protein
VLPESIKIGGGEGPSVVGSMRTVLMTFISLLGMLGVPLDHTAAVAPWFAWGGAWFSRLPVLLRLLLVYLGLKTGLNPGGR